MSLKYLLSMLIVEYKKYPNISLSSPFSGTSITASAFKLLSSLPIYRCAWLKELVNFVKHGCNTVFRKAEF